MRKIATIAAQRGIEPMMPATITMTASRIQSPASDEQRLEGVGHGLLAAAGARVQCVSDHKDVERAGERHQREQAVGPRCRRLSVDVEMAAPPECGGAYAATAPAASGAGDEESGIASARHEAQRC